MVYWLTIITQQLLIINSDIEGSLFVWGKIQGWPRLHLSPRCGLSTLRRSLPGACVTSPGPRKVEIALFPHRFLHTHILMSVHLNRILEQIYVAP